MYVTLEQAKQQLTIDKDVEIDDELIVRLIEVAEAVVSKSLCRPLESCLMENGRLISDVEHQVLLMVEHFYENRGAVTHGNAKEAPLSYKFINALNKDYSA